jgi:hypothetical protein
MAVYCPFMSTEGGAFDVECAIDCMFYDDGTQGSCKLIASTGIVPVSSSTFATSAKQDTLNNAVGYTGVTTDTLKNDLTAQIIKLLKSLGFGNTDLSFGRVSDDDDLKGNIGFNPPGASLDVSLKAWLNGLVGAAGDRDTGNVSLYSYLKDVFGKNSEKDDSQSLIVYLKTLIGIKSERDDTNSFVEYFKDILGIHSNKITTDQTLLMIDKHGHDSHLHPFKHSAATVPATAGSDAPMDPITPPKAASLIAEFMGDEDLDKNGAIYGYDFMINGTDPEKPNMLKSIENMPDWSDPVCKITWAQYLVWVDGGASPC